MHALGLCAELEHVREDAGAVVGALAQVPQPTDGAIQRIFRSPCVGVNLGELGQCLRSLQCDASDAHIMLGGLGGCAELLSIDSGMRMQGVEVAGVAVEQEGAACLGVGQVCGTAASADTLDLGAGGCCAGLDGSGVLGSLFRGGAGVFGGQLGAR